MSVKGKVIVITGAASGLGRETARVFASKGAKLSLADIQEKPLKDFEAELKQAGAEVISQVVDVRKREDVNSWIAATVAKFGNLDGAANMASVLGPPRSMAKIEDTKDEDWDFVMGINVTGLRNCLQAQIPHFNTGGSIVNIASITGLKGAESQSAYSTSKHAVVGMTRSIAKELGPRNIRANCICPGPIDTPMLKEADDMRGAVTDFSWLPLGRRGRKEEVPPLMEFLITDASSFMTGAAIPIDGGWDC